ncbi:hypothetical protein HYW32_00020 [Candidatus Berkelbacteria bacterium]|nr:hypothetical protein [Candidatus Berkelbacteria bacterium]
MKYNLYVGDVSVEAVFNKLGGLEGARAFLRGEQKLVPVLFERNEHGHIVLTVTGLDLTGEQEVKRLEAAGFCLGNWAKSCLLSTEKDGYNTNHRLVDGQSYKIALMPTREIKRDSDRTVDVLRKRGIEKYGYEKPLAGIVPRIRETVSAKRMEEMGFEYIVAPHDTIKDSDGHTDVLGAHRFDDGPWLYAIWTHPGICWDGNGAFAFLVPASLPAGKAG